MSNLTYDISGLDDGELYEFVVYSANESGSSYDSSMVSVRTIPGVPTGLDLSARELSMYYNFAAMTGATSYTIYYGTTPDASGAFFTTVSVSGTINNLLAGKLYYVKVSATNASGESAKSAAVSEYVTPTAPTGLVVVGGLNRVDLSYNAVSESNGYNVYLSVSGGTFVKHNTTALITGTTYSISGLLAGTNYRAYVRSVRLSVENGAEIISNVSLTVSVFTRPDVPQITTLTTGTNQITVGFTPETGATSYKVYYGLTSGAINSSISSISGSPVDITGLVDGKLYYFQVTAINSGGESVRSTIRSEYVIPVEPTGVNVIAGINKIIVTYNAVSESDGYNVYISVEGGTYVKNNNNLIIGTSYTSTVLDAGTLHRAYVRSVRLSISGGTQIVSPASVGDATYTIADVPAITTLTPGVSKITVAFTSEIGAISYKIYYGLTSGALDLSKGAIAGSPIDITGLTSGKRYYFQATSINTGGESNRSNIMSEYVIPTAPTGLLAVGGVNKVTVTYNAVSESNGYNVYYRILPSGSFTKHNTSLITGTTYDVSSLLAGTQYAFYVKSVRLSIGSGTEIESSASNFENEYTIPDVPAITDLTTGVNKMTVTFSEETGAASYKVYYGLVSGALDLSKATVTASPLDITGLTSGKLYYFQATAINEDGESSRSTEVSRRVIPAIPQNVSIVGGINKVTVLFTDVADKAGYNVYYRTESGSFQKYNTLALVSGSPYELTGLTAGERYYVYVRSVVYSNNSTLLEIESADSSTVNAYVIPDVTAVTSTSALTTTISVVFDTKYGATSYKVYYGTVSGVYDLSRSGVTSSPTTLSALTSGTTYYIAATTLNAAGESAKSVQVSQITRALPPTGLVAVGKVGAIDISYVAAVGASSYTVSYGLSGSFTNSIIVSGTTAEITGLLYGYYYNIKVSSNNNAGESQTSSTTVYAITIGNAPSIITISGKTREIQVSIPQVTGTTSYKIYYGTVASGTYDLSRTFAATGAITEVFTINNLLDGTAYNFKATTNNPTGESSFSISQSSITIPGKPSFASVVAGVEKVSVTINGQTGAKSYTVYYGEEGSFTQSQVFTSLTGDITGLIDGRNYNFRVTATNDSGESVYSDIVYERIIPDQPGNNTISAIGYYDKITVTLNRIENASSYVVYYGLSGDFSSSTSVIDPSGSATSITVDISGLQAGKYYGFRYTTKKTDVDSATESEPSIDIAYARIAPAASTFVQAVGGVRKATLTFTPVEGATRYVVKYRKIGKTEYTEYPAFYM